MRRLWPLLALLAVTVACTDGDDGNVEAGSGPRSPGRDTLQVDCGGSVFDFDWLTDAPLIESLADGPASAVDDAGAPAFDPTQDWRGVDQTDERGGLLRKVGEAIHNRAGA